VPGTNEVVTFFEAVKRGDEERVAAMLEANRALAEVRDDSGATPLHYAALNGHREVARLLVERGAEVNSTDGEFRATPAGWAIEYLREMGGLLAIELDDFAYAIEVGDARWAARILERFPSLRQASDTKGRPFRQLALESGNGEIRRLLGMQEAD
jgi:ankyrin repeat protein